MTPALLLLAAVQFSGPTTLADSGSCYGARPLYPADTLTARMVARDQSRFWWALGPYWDNETWWVALWPTVKAGADLRWQRDKRVTAGVRDTMRVPGQRPAFVEVRVKRNANGRWSCAAGKGAGP